jgi:hypothetical protein
MQQKILVKSIIGGKEFSKAPVAKDLQLEDLIYKPIHCL